MKILYKKNLNNKIDYFAIFYNKWYECMNEFYYK